MSMVLTEIMRLRYTYYTHRSQRADVREMQTAVSSRDSEPGNN